MAGFSTEDSWRSPPPEAEEESHLGCSRRESWLDIRKHFPKRDDYGVLKIMTKEVEKPP